ncbi:MAG: helix-turn-helix transcriptional regulator [Gaiellaceae bacterium]
MASPTSRLLELLELLQARPLTTGREVADLLGIDARTVRRYVGVLQELGIPVEGQRGVGGGYRVRPGYRLPPLMLGDEEAVVVVLGLLATRGSGADGQSAAVDRALAKINRVLPSTLRRQVEALEETLAFTATRGGAPADSAAVLLLADAIRRRRRLRTSYRSFSGEESERELSPHGLVVHSGRWYLAAYDHLRNDLRTFRVDRMWRVELACNGAAVPPPEGFDAVAHLTRSLAGVPWRWAVEVLLDLPVDEAARRIPATLAELVDDPGGTLVRMRVDSLDWAATVLAGLGCDFAVRWPDELRASVRALSERLAAQV